MECWNFQIPQNIIRIHWYFQLKTGHDVMIHHLLEFSFQNAVLEEFIKQTLINVYLVYTSGIYSFEKLCMSSGNNVKKVRSRRNNKKICYFNSLSLQSSLKAFKAFLN